MMRIGFDISPIKSGHKNRGVGFYTSNLLENLKNIEELELVEFTSLDKVHSLDVVHYPYFDFYFRSLPLKKRFATVVTVHDATPLVFKDQYPAGLRGSINFLFQKKALQSCKAVITVSNNAKDDIKRLLNIPEEKIHVVYSAPANHFKKIKNGQEMKVVRSKFNLPEQFALYVGNVNWNKNIINTAQACIDADIDLVIVGGAFLKRDNLDHPEMASFKKYLDKFSGNPRIHTLGFVDDEELVALYNLASLTLLVSFYEGFGFPILESQSCKTPVITSNCSSMPEIAGEGALFVNPKSVNEITEAIKKVTSDADLQKKLVKKGEENLLRFSWKKTAQEVVDVYKKII